MQDVDYIIINIKINSFISTNIVSSSSMLYGDNLEALLSLDIFKRFMKVESGSRTKPAIHN